MISRACFVTATAAAATATATATATDTGHRNSVSESHKKITFLDSLVLLFKKNLTQKQHRIFVNRIPETIKGDLNGKSTQGHKILRYTLQLMISVQKFFRYLHLWKGH